MNNKLSNSTNNIKQREVANDVFYTPKELAIQLINQIDYSKNDYLYDPFLGQGAFYDNFNHDLKEWAEIDQGRDFFSYEPTNKIDWIISNPPFSILTDVLIHSTNICSKGFAYIMPTYSLSYSRINLMSLYGFELTKIVFFQNPKSWEIGFQMCYVVFEKNVRNKTHTIKTLNLQKYYQEKLPIQ